MKIFYFCVTLLYNTKYYIFIIVALIITFIYFIHNFYLFPKNYREVSINRNSFQIFLTFESQIIIFPNVKQHSVRYSMLQTVEKDEICFNIYYNFIKLYCLRYSYNFLYLFDLEKYYHRGSTLKLKVSVRAIKKSL